MGNAIDQDRRAIWLAIRRHGGWWSVRQVVQHWHPTFAPWEVHQALQALAGAGFLAARDDVNPGTTSYAVTSDCGVIPGTEEEPREEGTSNGLHA